MGYSRLWDASGLTATGQLVLKNWAGAGAPTLPSVTPNVASSTLTARQVILGSVAGDGSTVITLPKSLHALYGQGSNGGTYGYMWGDGFWVLDDLHNITIRNLTLAFAKTTYDGHEKERGMNGLLLRHCSNVLIDQVTVKNADTALFLKGCNHVTIRRCVLDNAERFSWGTWKGHYGISLDSSHDCLIEDLDIVGVPYHAISVQGSTRNVIRNIRGPWLKLDHHRDPQGDNSEGNLWTDIDVGAGEAFANGGSSAFPLSIGPRETYWNVRKNGAPLATAPNWPKLTVVGFGGTESLDAAGRWLERVDALTPADLYAAQTGPVAPPPLTAREQVIAYFKGVGWSDVMIAEVLNG